MTEMKPRPKFIETYFATLADDVKNLGYWAIVPYVFGSCVGLGFIVAWQLPVQFWTNDKWDISTAVYAGLLAFSGLLLALGWSAFAKIYEIVSTGRIAKIFHKKGLLAEHLAFVDAVHATLLVSAMFNGLGLLSVLMKIPLWADRTILGLAITATAYSLVNALSATRMMNDLIWERVQLEHGEEDNGRKLESVV